MSQNSTMARSGSALSSSESSSLSCLEASSSLVDPSAKRPKTRRRLQDDLEAAPPEVAMAAEHFDMNPSTIKEKLAKGLPGGWVACQAKEGEVYYHCSLTGVSQWAHPRFTDTTKFEAVGKALKDGKFEDSKPPTQHSVYDARSRHVDLPTPESLFSDNVSSRVVREDLLTHTFALHDLLNKTEATSYVEAAAAHGFDDSDVAREFPSEVRNNSRLIHFSEALAVALWRRLAPQLLHRDIFLIQPMGYAAEGRWKPVGVNPCFRIGRYNEGEHFAAHRDGMYVNENGESSIYSIVLYLNDDFDGGELELPQEIIFQPRAGSALFFPHDTLHTARAPTRGVKYVARSELMFRCVDARPVPRALNFVCDPLFQRMAGLYAQIGDLAISGDAAKTTETYQEALGIQIAYKGTTDAADTDAKLPVPGRVLAQALRFLSPREVLATASVSSAWQMVTTAGVIWLSHCQQRWPRAQDVVEDTFNKFDPELKDWQGLYKRLHLASKSSAHVCTIFLSDKLEAGTNAGETMKPVPARASHRESGHPWDSSMKQRRGWAIAPAWGALHSWFEDNTANWQLLPELFKHAYHSMKVDPSSHRLLIPALPGVLSKLEKARLVRILTGRFHIPKVCIAPAPLCALLAHNFSTGTVVWGCSMGTSVVSCYIDSEEVTVVGPFNFHAGTPEDIVAFLQQAAKNLGEERACQALEHVVFSIHGPAKLDKSKKEQKKDTLPAWICVDEVRKLLEEKKNKKLFPFNTELHAHVEGDVVAGGALLAVMPELLTAFDVEAEINPRDENSWEWRLLADGKWYKLPAYCAGVLESALRNGKKSTEIQLGNFCYLVADLENFSIGSCIGYDRFQEKRAQQKCRLTRFLRGHPSSIPDTRIPKVAEKMETAIVEEVSDVEALHVRTMAGRVVLSIAKSDVRKIGTSVQELQEEVSDRCCVLQKQVTLLHEGRTLESTEALQPLLEENTGTVELLLLVGEKPVVKEEQVAEVILEDWPGECAELQQLHRFLGRVW